MKKFVSKTKGVVKGMPTAVLLSIAIHALLLLAASVFVVVKAVQKKQATFIQVEEAKVEKMDIKKPRPKMKKMSRPRSSRLTTQGARSMPSLALPAVDGIGEGLGNAENAFTMMPDAEDFSMYGSEKSLEVGNELEGTFYSFMYDQRNKWLGEQWNYATCRATVVKEFIDSGWNPIVWQKYYRSPKKLYLTHLCFPPFPSVKGPVAFGMPNSPEFDPDYWAVHYKGNIAAHESGEYRFVGTGDGAVAIRIGEKVVWADTWDNEAYTFVDGYETGVVEDDLKFTFAFHAAHFGPWFEMEEGVPTNMEVVWQNSARGRGECVIAVQKKGEIYPENDEGLPILPVFKTAPIPDAVRPQIEYELFRDVIDLDSDMMFNVH